MLVLLVLLSCGWLRDDKPRAKPERAERPERERADRAPERSSDRPNVLFIVWDTVRADHLGLYGYGRDTTPRLTAFAKDAAVYERAISSGVWTLPSHASMFTGLPPSAHGVSDRRKYLDDGFTTFAEVLERGGYATWAWSTNPFIDDKTNMTQGFDTVEHPWSPAWRRDADAMQKARGVDEASTRNEKVHGTPWGYTNVGKLAGRALDAWLDQRRGEPWLAFVNLMEAHATRSPILRARHEMMDDAAVARSLEIDQRTRQQNAYGAGVVPWTPADLAVIQGVYDASLLEIDHITGELLDGLRERGVLDDTLVILVADHGEMLGEKGLFGHQLAIWSSLTHVPLVVRYPGHVAPARITEPTSTASLFRLVIEQTGVPAPDAPGMDTSRHDLGAVTEYTEPMRSTLKTLRAANPSIDLTPFDQAWSAIEVGGKKLVVGSTSGSRVYEVDRDPGEERATADAAEIAELAGRMERWRGTFTAFDHEHAAPVAAPIDEEGPAREALRELGYVE